MPSRGVGAVGPRSKSAAGASTRILGRLDQSEPLASDGRNGGVRESMTEQTDLALRTLESTPGPGSEANRRLQELWIRLAKQEWTSIAVIPAHPGGAADGFARSLAAIGSRLSFEPVSAVTVKVLGPSSAMALSTLANHVRNRATRLWQGSGIIEVLNEPSTSETKDGGYTTTSGQLVLGIPSVLSEPVSLTVAHAADIVLLVAEKDRTRTKDVKRSIELIGRARIVGCCLV